VKLRLKKRGRVHRRAVVLALTLALPALTAVGGAAAAGPLHLRHVDSDTITVPAGERCDFAYRVTFTDVVHEIIFGDPEDPDRVIVHGKYTVSHTNLETGFTLHEKGVTNAFIYPQQGRGRQVGIFWHLRTPEGKLVVVKAGQVVFTFEGGPLKVTPHLEPLESPLIICPALGGNPA
jgi:hypothetical protein